MVRRTATVAGLMLLLLLSSLSFGKKLTTTQIRENTIRINALEVERVDITDIIEEPKQVGPEEVTVVMDDRALHFDFDKSNVKPQYFEMLHKFIEFVEFNNYDVVIEGHTDAKGSNAYNMALGMRRAQSVKAKLLEFGMPADRIVETVSRGEEMPVATNETNEGRALNRRIEFILKRRGQ